MENRLQNFLDKAFAPYGDFPARADVLQELRSNLLERYHDLKQQGKSDDEAYQITVESFGDVSEIMQQVPHSQPAATADTKAEPGLYRTIVDGIKGAATGKSTPMASVLSQADLTDTDLSGKDFSMSSLKEAAFDRSILRGALFKASDLKQASFIAADLTEADFNYSGMEGAKFDNANLTNTKLKGSGLKGVSFAAANLHNTEFTRSDLSDVSFDGLTLDGVIFDSSSLKNTSFKGSVFHNVSFHHAAVKQANFDGATMDKLTYALLKGAKATVSNVTVI